MFSTTDAQGILIVDDNPTNLEVLSEALIHEGFQVAVAIDGESALEQIRYHVPELILLDVMMPGIDGFETCRRLKEDLATAEIPVIFMTALSDVENKISGLALGAVDYIAKPFQHEEVIARVRVHLKLQNLSSTLKQQNYLLKAEIERREQMEAALLQANQELEDLNQYLEKRVDERTIDLSKALNELQETQVQMIQQEKLSSLGQLVAGIAHEINNPVNFIHGNLSYAQEYIVDLLKLLELYQKHYTQPHVEIQNQIDQIDLIFLMEDLPKMINSMQIGTDRICEIVLGLRNFSRLDEAEVKAVDLHEGLDSTLMILGSRLKGQKDGNGIQVRTSYGDLPLVKCFPGQLNQVFMNILSNAIDALEDTYFLHRLGEFEAQIHITTRLVDPDTVEVCISDNGAGIPADIQGKIFDPFFTTKPIGKGTGLGMSISYQIITEKHKGTLAYRAVPSGGAEFVMTIPVVQDVDD
jgi:two-component system, NtrC family, sensor kinase